MKYNSLASITLGLTCIIFRQIACSGMDNLENSPRINDYNVRSKCKELPGILIDDSANVSTEIGKSSHKIFCNSTSETQFKTSNFSAKMRKRSPFQSKFTISQQEAILNLHNEYRAKVKPEAANMKFMEWKEDAAVLAQIWAEKCVFEHGFPPNYPLSSKLGQNLYMGPDKKGLKASQLWFDEYKDYDISTLACSGDMCGHYTQMVWATSNFVGCGINRCSENQNLIVCNYYPAGNYVGEPPYKIGYPCSMCADTQNGGLCYNNSCVSQQQCNDLNLPCKCDLHCHNCGVLDATKCTCKCKHGWDELDCSVPCRDKHELCGKNPGFPGLGSCSTNNGLVRTELCRKMCKQCNAVTQQDNLSDLCCAGITCDEGKVLDQYCQCVPKCKGDWCSGGTSLMGGKGYRVSSMGYTSVLYSIILIKFGHLMQI